MSAKKKRTQRAQRIINEARELRNFYAAYLQPQPVRLFAEDYEYLLERKEIVERADRALLDGGIAVVKGGARKSRASAA